MESDLSARRPWQTRGELLAARAHAVPRLEQRLVSIRRLAGQVARVCVLTMACLLVSSAAAQEDGSGRIAVGVVVVGVVVGVVTLASSVRSALTTRSLIAELLAWEEIERAGRSLPSGDIRPEHRTLFDLPRDEYYEGAAYDAAVAALYRARRDRIKARAVASGLGIGVGLVLLLVGTVGSDGSAFAIGSAITGAVVLAVCLTAGVSVSRYSLRMRAVAIRMIRDSGAAAAERALRLDRIRTLTR
ncbi:hypothetical protein [Blastococcus sp. TF02-8]|uniref:hypothetical protein n=1 Tax=Blastococcus sp. TF02-8 TaxID=2250574 RepID=UPI0011BFD329|nr:hypothetical protein [Blastococcus sp. TF02-8]